MQEFKELTVDCRLTVLHWKLQWANLITAVRLPLHSSSNTSVTYEPLTVVLEGRYHINQWGILGNMDRLSGSLLLVSYFINATLPGHEVDTHICVNTWMWSYKMSVVSHGTSLFIWGFTKKCWCKKWIVISVGMFYLVNVLEKPFSISPALVCIEWMNILIPVYRSAVWIFFYYMICPNINLDK